MHKFNEPSELKQQQQQFARQKSTRYDTHYLQRITYVIDRYHTQIANVYLEYGST